MAWKVSPAHKKSITEIEIWRNDKGEYLKHTTQWRWGSWIVRDDAKPKLEGYDPEKGMDPYSFGDEVELEGMNDGDDYGFEYPASWKKKDIKKFEKLWEEEWHEAPITMGMQEDDTEYWVCGPLDIEEYGDSAPHGDDEEDGAEVE